MGDFWLIRGKNEQYALDLLSIAARTRSTNNFEATEGLIGANNASRSSSFVDSDRDIIDLEVLMELREGT